MFGRLPVGLAIRWLEALASDDPRVFSMKVRIVTISSTPPSADLLPAEGGRARVSTSRS